MSHHVFFLIKLKVSFSKKELDLELKNLAELDCPPKFGQLYRLTYEIMGPSWTYEELDKRYDEYAAIKEIKLDQFLIDY